MAPTLNGALPLMDASSAKQQPTIYTSTDLEPLIRTNESVWQFLMRINPDDTKPGKVILQEHEDRSKFVTYGGLREQCAQLAAGLKDVLGLSAGDTVAVVGPNTIAWALLAHSAMWGGITVAALNAMASAHEMVHYLAISGATVVFADEAIAKTVRTAIQMSDGGQDQRAPTVVILGAKSTSGPLSFPSDFSSEKVQSLSPLNLGNADNRKIPAAICFSSGTSGKPKAVMLSHHNLIAHMVGSRSSNPVQFNTDQSEVFYAPFAHIYGLVTALLSPAFNGHFVLILRSFSFYDYVKACAEVRATIMRVVPPTANALSKDPVVAEYDLKSVHTLSCAGAALGTEALTRLQKLMPRVSVIQGYGMTEGAITSLKNSASLEKMGSVGSVMTNAQVRLVDEDLRDVRQGAQGELLVRGPTVFMGYKNNPEANKEAFPFGDDWLRTGDVGWRDQDGYFYLTDRKKDLIKYKGNQVPPAELEDLLLSHPAVSESAVCAKWDPNQETEIPLAYVNLKADVQAHQREGVLLEIKAFVDSKVAPYKKLRGGVHYLPNIPRNPTGKLLRRLLPVRVEEDRRKALLAKRKAML